MTTETFKPTHELSTKSKQLKHNLFVWSLANPDMEGGLHLHSHNPITVSTLYRWIEIILTYVKIPNQRIDPALVEKTPFELYPAKVDQPPYLSLFCYKSIAVGDVIPRTSNEILQPGYLGIRAPAANGTSGFASAVRFPHDLGRKASFFAQEETRRMKNEEIDYCLSDLQFSTSVLERDNSCCAITATAERPLTITWIYPPWLGTKSYGFNGVTRKSLADDLEMYLGADNALSLRSDIADLFKQNQLGIDVDDNYRVVFFSVPDTLSPSDCRTHLDLSSIDPAIRPSDSFLRRHFRYCLLVNFLGSDISSEYEHFDIDAYLEEHDIENLSDVDVGHEMWQDEIGREVLRILLTRQLEGTTRD